MSIGFIADALVPAIVGSVLGVIVVIAVIVVMRSSAASRAKRAKKSVAKSLEDCGGYVFENYHVNIDGDDNVIDLIYVGPSGLYVAKVVMKSGKIYGDNMSKEWTCVSHGKEEMFESPVKDKDRLTNVLRKVVPEDYSIFACIVFMDADIKEVRCTNVMTFDGLKDYIKQRPKIFSADQVDEVKRILSAAVG